VSSSRPPVRIALAGSRRRGGNSGSGLGGKPWSESARGEGRSEEAQAEEAAERGEAKGVLAGSGRARGGIAGGGGAGAPWMRRELQARQSAAAVKQTAPRRRGNDKALGASAAGGFQETRSEV